MPRIAVTFSDEIYQKIANKAEENKVSMGHYVRELVDIGLRVKAMTGENNADKSRPDPILEALDFQKKLLRKGLTSSYETLYMTRYLLGTLPENNQTEISPRDMIEAARQKAQSYIAGLWGEEA